MTCEEVREHLPDYALGTLPETTAAAVRRHLRGCSGCRGEAAELDRGVAMFSSAAHASEPPAELKDRVMAALSEEWAEAPVTQRRPRSALRWMAGMAAALLALAGTLAWAGMAQTRANRFRADAVSYRQFLTALGGRDVRVAVLQPRSGDVEGSAILYDSDRGQSWVLVLVRSAESADPISVTLSSAAGRSIRLRPIEIDAHGVGSTWFVTSADISRFRMVRLYASDGRVLAEGTAISS